MSVLSFLTLLRLFSLSLTTSYVNRHHHVIQKVMSILSNAPPRGHGYQIYAHLNALDLTTLLQQNQQHFPLKVIHKMMLLPHDDNADPCSSYDYNHDDDDDDGEEE
ncbi:hypothetical protein MTR_6g004770 [Medicago truncatula]|uniref:Transmembrane protein n=1 Tax=Medicago truncatula TaxID=3880 RepID=A0A072UG79_MEDTR|nr:hypothetical protein MTR_6g004770 [Medicago truncatula]